MPILLSSIFLTLTFALSAWQFNVFKKSELCELDQGWKWAMVLSEMGHWSSEKAFSKENWSEQIWGSVCQVLLVYINPNCRCSLERWIKIRCQRWLLLITTVCCTILNSDLHRMKLWFLLLSFHDDPQNCQWLKLDLVWSLSLTAFKWAKLGNRWWQVNLHLTWMHMVW